MKQVLIFFLLLISFQGHSQSNWWMVSAEYSPSPRASNDRILNGQNAANGNFRARMGFKLWEQTFFGISGNYRSYMVRESAQYNLVLDRQPLNTNYAYHLSNNLVGIGTFITQYFEMTERFHLQASAFGLVEQGRGRYRLNLQQVNCHSCNEYIFGHNTNALPVELENTSFREQIYTAGLDLGSSYFLTSTLLLQANLTMFIFERFRISSANLDRQYGLPEPIHRPLLQGGDQYNKMNEMPVVHFGIMVLIGK